MNLNIDKKRNDYASISNKLNSNQNRNTEKSNHPQTNQQGNQNANQLDYYYRQSGNDLSSKPETLDLTKDYGNGTSQRMTTKNPSNQLFSAHNVPKKLSIAPSSTATMSPVSSNIASPQFDFRNLRADASLVPPIRQTASIFKQPVTVVKTQEGKVKTDLKHGVQEKPKQLFWEKRLENFQACDSDGTEFAAIDLPRQLKPVGPHVKDQTIFQSVATALHTSCHPVTGQTSSKTALATNPGVFVNPDQPLLYACSITEEDIRKQEDRVQLARKKLQEALNN